MYTNFRSPCSDPVLAWSETGLSVPVWTCPFQRSPELKSVCFLTFVSLVSSEHMLSSFRMALPTHTRSLTLYPDLPTPSFPFREQNHGPVVVTSSWGRCTLFGTVAVLGFRENWSSAVYSLDPDHCERGSLIPACLSLSTSSVVLGRSKIEPDVQNTLL